MDPMAYLCYLPAEVAGQMDPNMLQCLLCTTLDDSRKQAQNDVRNAPNNGREKARRKEHESHNSDHTVRLNGVELFDGFSRQENITAA